MEAGGSETEKVRESDGGDKDDRCHVCKSSLILTYHKAILNSTNVWDCRIVRSDSASVR
jgi:hypothetical protein